MRLAFIAAVSMALASSGCEAIGLGPSHPPHEPPCEIGEYEYRDYLAGVKRTGRPDLAGLPVGDGLCYRLCETDRDCEPVGADYACGNLGLYEGHDYNCQKILPVCRARGARDCSPP